MMTPRDAGSQQDRSPPSEFLIRAGHAGRPPACTLLTLGDHGRWQAPPVKDDRPRPIATNSLEFKSSSIARALERTGRTDLPATTRGPKSLSEKGTIGT